MLGERGVENKPKSRMQIVTNLNHKKNRSINYSWKTGQDESVYRKNSTPQIRDVEQTRKMDVSKELKWQEGSWKERIQRKEHL